MALNIPLPQAPDVALSKAFTQGTDLYNMLMQHAIQRAQNKRLEEMQPYNIKNIESIIQNRQSSNARQQALLNPRIQQLQDAHEKFLLEKDPEYKANQFRSLIKALSEIDNEENLQKNQLGINAPPVSLFNEGFDAQSMPQGQGMFPIDDQGMQIQSGLEKPSSKGLTKEQIKRAAAKMAFGIDLLKPSSADKSLAYQGVAREGYDLARLKNDFGENSEEYRNALSLYNAKLQNSKDLQKLRERTIGGLKPGDKWIIDPESGEHVGIETKLTPKEIERESGRNLFDIIYPYVYQGAGPFSGEGSINNLRAHIKNYKTNPQSQKIVDDYLLADKLMSAAVVNEAATLNSGKTNQTYNRLYESLKAGDIPKQIDKILKQYKLPAEAQIKAAVRFHKILIDATKQANQLVPATKKLYFDPSSQFNPSLMKENTKKEIDEIQKNIKQIKPEKPISEMTDEEIEAELALLKGEG